MEVKVIALNRLAINGYVYKKQIVKETKTLWMCVRHDTKDERIRCPARATTSNISASHEQISILKGPSASAHNHPPDPEEVEFHRSNTGKNRGPLMTTARLSQIERRAGPGASISSDQTQCIEKQRACLESLLKFLENPSVDMKESLFDALDAHSESYRNSMKSTISIRDSLDDIRKESEVSLNNFANTTAVSIEDSPNEALIDLLHPDISFYTETNFKKIESSHLNSSQEELEKKSKVMDEQPFTSAHENNFEVVHPLTQLVETRKHKREGKKRKKKKDKGDERSKKQKRIRLKIIPPVPNAVPITHQIPESKMSFESSTKDLGKEIIVIDLTDENDQTADDLIPIQSNLSISEPMSSSMRCHPNTPATSVSELPPENGYQLMNKLTAYPYMPISHSVVPFMGNNSFPQTVTTHYPTFVPQYLPWQCSNMLIPPSQGETSNGFVADMQADMRFPQPYLFMYQQPANNSHYY